jgi:hypothetical protein
MRYKPLHVYFGAAYQSSLASAAAPRAAEAGRAVGEQPGL